MKSIRFLLVLGVTTGVLLTAPACTCTRAVWAHGRLLETPGTVEKAWLSDHGDICLVYRATVEREEARFEHGYLMEIDRREWRPLSGEEGFRRVLLVPLDEVAEKGSVCASQCNDPLTWEREGLAGSVTPRGLGTPGVREEHVARLTEGWQELDVAQASEPVFSTQRQDGPEAADRVVQTGRDVELPSADGRRIAIRLPVRRRISVRSYPARVLLTPPAIAADTAAGGFVVLLGCAYASGAGHGVRCKHLRPVSGMPL